MLAIVLVLLAVLAIVIMVVVSVPEADTAAVVEEDTVRGRVLAGSLDNVLSPPMSAVVCTQGKADEDGARAEWTIALAERSFVVLRNGEPFQAYVAPGAANPSCSSHMAVLPHETSVSVVAFGDPLTTMQTIDPPEGTTVLSATVHGAFLYASFLRDNGAGVVVEMVMDATGIFRGNTVVPHDSSAMDGFGRHITVTDRVMFASGSNTVSVLYRKAPGTEWVQVTELYPPAGTPHLFGFRTEVAPGALLISSPLSTGEGAMAGVVVAYPWRDGRWGSPVDIVPPRPASDRRFGSSMAVDGDHVWIGDREVAHCFRLTTVDNGVLSVSYEHVHSFAPRIPSGGRITGLAVGQESLWIATTDGLLRHPLGDDTPASAGTSAQQEDPEKE